MEDFSQVRAIKLLMLSTVIVWAFEKHLAKMDHQLRQYTVYVSII